MVRATLQYERQAEESTKKVKLEVLQNNGRTDKFEVYAYEDGPEEEFLTLLQDFKDADLQFKMSTVLTGD